VKETPPQSTENRRRYFGKRRWCLLALLLAACAYPAWREYDYRCAVREAEAAGFDWTSYGPLDAIKRDWRAVIRKETWAFHDRGLYLGKVPDLGRYRDLIRRLRPTALQIDGCESVDALKGLTSLQVLWIRNCPTLKNVDALQSLTSLHSLSIWNCAVIQNIDVLKGLTSLRSLGIGHCPILQNVDSLKGLTSIKTLSLEVCPLLQSVGVLSSLTDLTDLRLIGCTSLKDVDGLKSLTALNWLRLRGSINIPASALRELSAALPKTNIIFPDGTASPPK
jgi:hypothetical protein